MAASVKVLDRVRDLARRLRECVEAPAAESVGTELAAAIVEARPALIALGPSAACERALAEGRAALDWAESWAAVRWDTSPLMADVVALRDRSGVSGREAWRLLGGRP